MSNPVTDDTLSDKSFGTPSFSKCVLFSLFCNTLKHSVYVVTKPFNYIFKLVRKCLLIFWSIFIGQFVHKCEHIVQLAFTNLLKMAEDLTYTQHMHPFVVLSAFISTQIFQLFKKFIQLLNLVWHGKCHSTLLTGLKWFHSNEIFHFWSQRILLCC